MSVKVEPAVAYVEQHGTELERCRLARLRSRDVRDEPAVHDIILWQNGDGGWPGGPDHDYKGPLSSIVVSQDRLELLLELGLEDSPMVERTVAFLLQVQGEAGTWCESEAILEYDPPGWMAPCTLANQVWQTACIAHWLLRLGRGGEPQVQKAVNWLRDHWMAHNQTFIGYPHATWYALATFGLAEGLDSPVVKKCVHDLVDLVDEVDLYEMPTVVNCFRLAGGTWDDPLTQLCLARLVAGQRRDGAWEMGYGEEYAVDMTLCALRTLAAFDLIQL
jgi:hypothetical protein